MNKEQASQQVQHMRDFIIHEAKEKADEIDAKAEQDYTVETMRLVEEEKRRIQKDIKRREDNVELESKMYVSVVVARLVTNWICWMQCQCHGDQ